MGRPMRRALIAAAVLAACGVLAFQLALHTLRGQIADALGPRGEVARIDVGLHALVLHDVRIRARQDGGSPWPAGDELRARRIEIVPQLRDLLSARVRVERIMIEGGYLSVMRTRDGRLRLLPAMLEREQQTTSGTDRQGTAQPSGGGLPVRVERIELRSSALDVFDASVRRKPHLLALEGVQADIGPVVLPQLDDPVTIAIDAVLKGPQHNGRVALNGEVVPATRDASLVLSIVGADLVAFQPYLIRAADTRVKRGTMDLEIRPVVRAGRLRAPGTLTLRGLELDSGSTFMGMSRAAVVGLLKDRADRISVNFTLEGQLDDPAFSLNESFATRVAGSVADTLGVSLGGLVRGVGKAGGSVLEGVGDAVDRLLGD
ncbi:MAG: DUF748 domain-containing protein [Gammaproteobacteria bacterium]|nr:DUF748 domain-containing protein [Gammaproteobacteria bacterium]MBU0771849.1 DUF748 domain-containing protein [Gammaproteobacteria bacterium]MBU0856130.1 DUF748 domain-containing protein [Gammaproteobacteria bacterium]MBU1846167.1 DUF748 domain-containing protein [Gammaproteobacteria bacterium]